MDGNFQARPKKIRRGYDAATEKVREELRQESETIYIEDLSATTERVPEPHFPFLIFFAAVGKDIVDGLDVTGVGVIVTTLVSFTFALILFIWCLGKMKGGWWKKRFIRWMFLRYGVVMILEMLPFVKIVPVATFFIWMVYKRETALVKLINAALEQLHKSGFRV